MVGLATVLRVSTANRGVSGLHHMRRSVYHEIRWNVTNSAARGGRSSRYRGGVAHCDYDVHWITTLGASPDTLHQRLFGDSLTAQSIFT